VASLGEFVAVLAGGVCCGTENAKKGKGKRGGKMARIK
jgi:hypothetical protein